MFFWLLPMWILAVDAIPDGEPVGMLLQVKGVVSLERANSAISKAQPMDLVYMGDKLTTNGANQVVLVFLADGHQEEVLANAVVTIGKTNCDPDSAVKRLPPKHQGKGVQTGLNEIKQSGRGAATVLRGEKVEKAIPEICPIAGATVITDSPTLSWKPIPQATGYIVELQAAGTARVIWTIETDRSTIAYPKDQPPLERRKLYHWSVRTKVPNGVERAEKIDGRFTVASAVAAEQLEEVAVLAQSDKTDDLILAVAIYAASGVHDSALAVFEKLCLLDPTDATFQTARARYYDLAGRPKDADEARGKARETESRRSKISID